MRLRMSKIGCQLSCFFNWFSWMFSSTFAAVRLSLADWEATTHRMSYLHILQLGGSSRSFSTYSTLWKGTSTPFFGRTWMITTGPTIYSIYSKIFCHSMIYHVLIALLNRAPKINIWPKLQTWVLTIRMCLNLTGTCLASWRVSISLSLFFNVFYSSTWKGHLSPPICATSSLGKFVGFFSQWHGESNRLTPNSYKVSTLRHCQTQQVLLGHMNEQRGHVRIEFRVHLTFASEWGKALAVVEKVLSISKILKLEVHVMWFMIAGKNLKNT